MRYLDDGNGSSSFRRRGTPSRSSEWKSQRRTIQRKKLRVEGRNRAMTTGSSAIPSDDLARNLTVVRPNEDQTLPHIALAGDTHTRFCSLAMILRAATASLTCSSRLEAVLLRIVTISRRCSPFSRAKSNSFSAAPNRFCEPARSLISRPMRRIGSAVKANDQRGCSVFARRPGRKNSSWRSAPRLRLERHRRPN